MADERFYVRVRGKISGPFDIATLQKLVRRGTLSRIHEISSDRAAWSAAGDYEDLFPSVPVVSSQPAANAYSVTEAESARAPAAVAAAPSHILYFYTQRGSTVGPVPLSVLKTLAENGTLRKDDLVWRENSDTGAAAIQMPALAPIYGNRGAGRPLGYMPAVSQSGDPDSLAAAVAAVARQSHWIGVTAGAAILLLINLPWVKVGDRIFCWWDLYQASEAAAWAYFATLLVVVGVALCIVAPLLKGIARGIVYLSLMAGIWIFFCATMLDTGATLQNAATLVVPVALSLLTGVCAFRSSSHQSGRVLLGIFSGIVTVGMFIAVLDSMQEGRPMDGLPPGLVTSIILVFIGLLSGLAAGIMGFVGLKPSFTPGLNLATKITALGGLALPGLGLFVAMSAASADYLPGFHSNSNSELNWIIFTVVIRILTIFYACAALTSVGLQELLTAARLQAIQQV
jgi:hypothetical protein